jgi:hypothetical protein
MTDPRIRSSTPPYRDLFPDHDLTPDERAAHDEDPQSGSCFGPDGADSYLISQSDTDILIRVELWSQASPDARAQLEALIGVPRWRPGWITDPMVPTTYQRGGIDSDPLVRMLAYRAWGDRDRRWFEDHGVRSGDIVAATGRDRRGSIKVALAWNAEARFGRAMADAHPGEIVEVERIDMAAPPERCRVTDRTRVGSVGR